MRFFSFSHPGSRKTLPGLFEPHGIDREFSHLMKRVYGLPPEFDLTNTFPSVKVKHPSSSLLFAPRQRSCCGIFSHVPEQSQTVLFSHGFGPQNHIDDHLRFFLLVQSSSSPPFYRCYRGSEIRGLPLFYSNVGCIFIFQYGKIKRLD
jgi:hypothetical protein